MALCGHFLDFWLKISEGSRKFHKVDLTTMKNLKNQKMKAVEVFSLRVAAIRGRLEKGSLP
jgi:hypothetical protein